MADDHARDELLAQLQRELAHQRTAIADLRAERHRPRHRLPRRFLPLALVALLVLLTPLSLLAAAPFNDLTGGVHDANIGLIYDAGITKGCVPNASYCPTGNVTREEVASFLARTAGLGDNPPVVNAKTAQTVPDNSVTTAKLSRAGSRPGQALVSTRAGVAHLRRVRARQRHHAAPLHRDGDHRPPRHPHRPRAHLRHRDEQPPA